MRHMRLFINAAFLVTCLLSLKRSVLADELKVMSVCEILDSLRENDGSLVSIRGIVENAGHGDFLVGERCRELTVKGYKWPSVVALTSPRDLTRIHDVTFDFDLDA